MITLSGDTRELNNLINALSNPREIVSAAVEIATANASNEALRQAQETPRPAVHPFKWSNDPAANARARRWYFAAISRGEINTNGERYVRTGDFGRSFDTYVEDRGDSIDVVFGSNAQSASYIVGDADGSLSQIPGHSVTGWWEFSQAAQNFASDVITGVERELPRVFERRA